MPEHFKVVFIPCKALYKCSALPLLITTDTVAYTHTQRNTSLMLIPAFRCL